MIPQELVDRVRDSADIVQIIGEHVKLKRAGADFRGPCPFHGGKNPNFSVSPRRAMYHCFKCGETGNVFTFLQKHLGMSFPDAVRAVAATEGIEIPEYTPQRSGPDLRERFWEVNAIAVDFFKSYLWNEAAAEDARQYLVSRDITRDAAEQYGLGFAPREIGIFRAHMETLGFDEERLLEAGLLVKPDEQSEPRPRFRSRVIFTIYDGHGNPVGFGGRALGHVEPKYLNSPETVAFQKGKTLYALNWTKNDIRKADRVFVVEGYVDALRLMMSGLNTVVAPLGTALTDMQASLLTRYTKNIYLLYDSDQAGLKATFRAGDELLRQGASVRVITLPGGDDPDTYVHAHGREGLEAQVTNAVDVFERKLQILTRGGWFNELQKKRRALDRLLPTIRATSDSLLRDLYLTRTAELTGIGKETLLRELTAPANTIRRGTMQTRSGGARSGWQRTQHEERDSFDESTNGRNVRVMRPVPVPGSAPERELVRVMLLDPARIPAIAERVYADQFRDPYYRAIFEAMLPMADEFNVERLAEALGPKDIMVLNELLDEPEAIISVDDTIAASISEIALREVRERLAEIETLMPVASDEEQTALLREKMRLQAEIAHSGQPANKNFKYLKNTGRRKRA